MKWDFRFLIVRNRHSTPAPTWCCNCPQYLAPISGSRCTYSISSLMHAERTLLRNPAWSSASRKGEGLFRSREGGIWLGLGSPCLMSSGEKGGRDGRRKTSMKGALSLLSKAVSSQHQPLKMSNSILIFRVNDKRGWTQSVS